MEQWAAFLAEVVDERLDPA